MKSKNFNLNGINFFLLFLTLLLLFPYLINSKKFQTEKTDSDRLKFYNNKANEISSGKINFAFNSEKGVYALVNKDIKINEVTLKVPRDYILCDYDIFPFKFELKEGVMSYFMKIKLLPLMEGTPSNILFAFYLMFLNSNKKEEIFEKLRKEKMSYYIIEPKHQAIDYLKTLPEYIYGISMYGVEEILLLKKLQIPYEKVEYDDVLDHTIKYIERKYPKFKDYILPWINDPFSFRRNLAIIHSRTRDVLLKDYSNLIGKPFIETPMGVIHKDIMDEILMNKPGTCLIPFFDLCNNYTPVLGGEVKAPTKFSLTFDNKGAKIFVEKYFRKGEEYAYSYFAFPINDNLLRRFGYYLKRDDNYEYHLKIALPYHINKTVLTEQKYKMCIPLNCFENNIDEFYYDKKILKNSEIYLVFNSDKLNENFLNLLRIINIKDIKQTEGQEGYKIAKKLIEGRWLSYENEILSLALYRKYFYEPEILSSLQITKNHYEVNKNQIEMNSEFYHKIKMREQILNVGRENQIRYIRNISFANKRIQEVLQDQFNKLRNFFVK